jgi:hypothetical protein
MTPEAPAQGILKRSDWGDAKTYQVVCDCGQSDHDHNIWVEAEETGITVSIYTTAKSPWYSMNRFKQIWTLITKGYLEMETVVTFNEQVALNYANVLQSAITDVKQFRKERDGKIKSS